MSEGGNIADGDILCAPTVAIYREMLLNYNEPFIRAQGEGLRRYRAIYTGASRVDELQLPRQRTLVMRDCFGGDGSFIARAGVAMFKRLGYTPPAFVRQLRRHHPVLLHAYTGVSGAHALPLARKLRIPLIVTCTGYEATATDAELARWPSRGRVFLRRREQIKREVALFIAVSAFIRDRLIARGWPAEKIVVHYVGASLDEFQPDPNIPREPIVLFVGRLIETKGVLYLIEGIRLLGQRDPALPAKLVLIGDGPLRRQLERHARDAGIDATCCGTLPQPQVRQWMNRAALLAVPSVDAADGTVEALPAVLFEAMAMALPAVGFSSGGIPEAISHNETGLLAHPRDAAALSSHIHRLLTDAPLWSRLSVASQRRADEQFDLTKQNAALEELYDQIVQRVALRK